VGDLHNTSVYDMVIVGAGQAGLPLASALAKKGWQVAVAERRHLGGSCVNFGCTPTKAVLASAKLAYQAKRASEYGITIPQVEVDYAAVLERARRISTESRESLKKTFDEGNPELLEGHAKFVGRDGEMFKLEVNGQTIAAKQVVINTGTRTALPKTEGLEETPFVHSGNWLDENTLPEHIVILGAGYIALEMSQFYRRMGSRVTVIGDSSQVVEREDEDVATVLQTLLQKENITFYLNTNVTSVQKKKDKIVITFNGKGDTSKGKDITSDTFASNSREAQTIEASHLFIATGRKPNTDDLGLESIGVNVNDKGIIEVDERLASNVSGIWVAGDVRGGGMFTHSSYDDYRILESQLVGDKAKTTKRIIPYAIFTDPNLARAGMSEKEAKQKGEKFKSICYEVKKNGKAREIGETQGFIKVLVDTDTQKLLGAAVLSSEAAEIIHPYILMMQNELPYTALESILCIHPTLSEAVQSALKQIGEVLD
jgi:pyruvate/2-oxoglutarate dehydrogenase complex dihydrolipoamide dehydrogenase (E3) component